MRKQFEKDSIEMLMFREYYNIIQKYWVVEDTDQYWQELIDEMDAFYKKYQDEVPLARKIGKAFMDLKYKEHKEGRSE